jgi:hypothetical protein
MSTKRDPTLSQLIMSRMILRLVLVIVALSIIGLLILLWIELTNPKLLESASANHSVERLQQLFQVPATGFGVSRAKLVLNTGHNY